MSVINQFIKQYNKEFDFYQKLAQIIAGKIEDELSKRGVKAIVSHRAKRPDRLKEKLEQRNVTKKYTGLDDIFADIVDLSGIRVSLYFPSDRDVIDEIVRALFIVEKQKKFPEDSHKPKHEKRFSGYWATHYRIKIKEDGLLKRYQETLSEIQVASVLMHAWSEVEHDLVYKPFSGTLSKEETSILDEINGLVMSGEIALERLQSAMAERTQRTDQITNKYELTNFLINRLGKNQGNVKLGDTFSLNTLLSSQKKFDTKDLEDVISRVNFSSNESFTDQLLQMLLLDTYKSDKSMLKKYFKSFQLSESKASGFESFIKCWVVLEKAVREHQMDSETESRKYFVPDLAILAKKEIIDADEAGLLKQFRQLRNSVLHGHANTNQDEAFLKNSFNSLRELTLKIIRAIPKKSVKESLRRELNLI